MTRISIHAPREGCDVDTENQDKTMSRISIHAPREGYDVITERHLYGFRISIHAPREGCDRAYIIKVRTQTNFNPRTP